MNTRGGTLGIDGNLLQAIIMGKNLSQKSVAHLAEINPGTLSNIICGRTKPSYEVIVKLKDTLDLRPNELIRIFFNERGGRD